MDVDAAVVLRPVAWLRPDLLRTCGAFSAIGAWMLLAAI